MSRQTHGREANQSAESPPEPAPLAPTVTRLESFNEASIKQDFVETARSPPVTQPALETSYVDDLSPQVSKASRSLRLEPPPVVIRPPTVKYDGFSLTALSFLSWTRNSEIDAPDCARSTRWSYSYRSTFQLFGLSISRGFNLKTSESGIDTAVGTIRFGWGKSEASWVLDHALRIRKRLGNASGNAEPSPEDEERQDGRSQENSSTTAVEGQKHAHEPGRHVPNKMHRWLNDYYYVVVGLMGEHRAPKETLRRVMQMDGLFHQIRRGHRQLRSPIRRMFSFKEVSGFGIYECDPSKGYHREVELDAETEGALGELWRSYNTHKLDWEGRWLLWIHQHFNNSSKNPEMGRLTLELKLRWSVFKVVVWGVVPILLSLAVGFWYMYSDHGEVDDVAVAEAAWVIASYIVTASALIFALLAVITQLGNI